MLQDQKLRLAGPERVLPGANSEVFRKMTKNAEWLFSLDPERLLAEPIAEGLRKDTD